MRYEPNIGGSRVRVVTQPFSAYQKGAVGVKQSYKD